MVRSLPYSPSSPWFSRLDPKRIAGTTLAITAHVVALGVLLVPTNWEPPARPAPARPIVVQLDPLPPKPITETSPPPTPQPVQPRNDTVRPVTPVTPIAPDPAPVFSEGEIATPALPDPGPAISEAPVGPVSGATLAYDVAPPPRYPRIAVKDGLEGTVMLRVLVDVDGRPLEVVVERGSGHRVLDRAAREQVLEHWRFHPALRDGAPVQAWGLVPIEFRLP